VEAACKESKSKCFVSNVLCLGNTTVSGSLEACDAVVRLAESFGATKAVKLNVAGAFHSEFMRPAYDSLKKILETVTFHEPRIPVVFNVDGEEETNAAKIKEKLLNQLVQPVLWEKSMNRCLKNYGLAHVIEVGPGNVLTGLMRRILRDIDLNPKPKPSTLSI
jgi:[acyl-carrier-protein] S-malonyltransferase